MEKIAIIGFGCLFPDAKNPEEFWQNLIQQKNSISSLTFEEIGVDPQIFFDPAKGKPDKIYCLKGGFIRDFKFDSTGYKLPPKFLESLDKTFQWSLYVAKQALEHSGYLHKEAVLSRCGVILGNLSLPTKSSNQLFAPIYQQVLAPAVKELLQKEEFAVASLASRGEVSSYNAMISGLPAAIIAQAFSLSNIHFCIDAACSSPQYAIRLASHYLWTHKADLMLAGGISCADPLFLRMLFSAIQAYPEDEISRPLDKTSRGMLTAEGVGMVVLKRYSDAVRDGDRIYATICGNGLSNDGRGKHLLSPNSKGQILAFERAYQEAGINPRDIDYLECHATGTFLGDATEFQSIEAFFGKYKARPLLGSVKSNVGHLLTAAGSVSLLKVLMSMCKGIIPATINITEPMGSKDNVVSQERIVTSTTSWPDNVTVKRAAISAFGLGGTNAHMILEQANATVRQAYQMASPVTSDEPLRIPKLAIVGMDAFFGACDGLDAFESSIYEGTQHFIPLPPRRWHGVEKQQELLKKYGLPDGKAPQGAYITDFEIDTISSKIPPNELEKLNQQQLLMLKVAERALKDAGIKEGANVAVVIAIETQFSVHQLQQRWNISWQLKEGLIAGEISLPPDKVSQLETIVKDSIHHPVESSEYVSYIANITASRISSLWDFTAPVFTVTAAENSTFQVLEVAQHLLAAKEADAVLIGAVDLAGTFENVLLRNQLAAINTGTHTLSYDQRTNGWTVGEGAGAVVLKLHETAKTAGDRIYAVVDAISFAQQSDTVKAVTQVCQQALYLAGVKHKEVNYLEVYGSGVDKEDEAEIKGLLQAYSGSGNDLNCAIGSVKANIGHSFVASGIASLIKTALCIYYRYIPGVPQWSEVKHKQQFAGSPFYVAPESRPWFLDKQAQKRIAAINSISMDGTCAHAILSEEPEQKQRHSRFLQQTPFYLFPIAGHDRAVVLTQIDALENSIHNGTSLANAANLAFTNFKLCSAPNYVLAILAHNQKELLKEIEAARKGINKAFDSKEEWQTPLGSYFTAEPLGKKGEVACVYPAAVNSYLGIARNLFRLFPKILDDIAVKQLQDLVADISRIVFPRSLNKLSSRQLEILEQQFLDNPLAIFDVDMLFARFITQIMRDEFQLQPKMAFGYSLGETSMMVATGVWDDFTQGIIALHASTLFSDRLSGAKKAVREYWKIPSSQYLPNNDFWANYVLMTTPSQLREYLQHEPRVFLTQINTPEEVVIAGEPAACERIIQILGCNAFRAPFDHVIHCEAMASEYAEIAKINTLPVRKNLPDVVLYTAAEYGPVKLESQAIAHSIAKGLSQLLDFPRLVNRVYEDGARIFIETGAGNVCSRWINKILNNKEHVTVSLNRRGLDDHSGIVKALAKLVSHQVPVDLSPLYPQVAETFKKSTLRKVTLGGESFTDKILTEENKKLFQSIAANSQSQIFDRDSHEKNIPSPQTQPQEISMQNIMDNSLEAKKEVQFRKLAANNFKVHKTHAEFLKYRQEFSQQMSELIKLQIMCANNLLPE